MGRVAGSANFVSDRVKGTKSWHFLSETRGSGIEEASGAYFCSSDSQILRSAAMRCKSRGLRNLRMAAFLDKIIGKKN